MVPADSLLYESRLNEAVPLYSAATIVFIHHRLFSPFRDCWCGCATLDCHLRLFDA
jgi:hypothetical protein